MNKLERKLNKFLSYNDFECSCEMGEDFSYSYATSCITFTRKKNPLIDSFFLKYALKHGFKNECSLFMLSFLHELGHNETIDLLNNMDIAYSEMMKETLEEDEQSCEIYFDLPIEAIATRWAINYIGTHTKEIQNLEKCLQRMGENLW